MIVLIMISTVKANETHTYLKKKKKKLEWNIPNVNNDYTKVAFHE